MKLAGKFLQGQGNRQRAGHALNADSSRSHTIVSVLLDLIDAGKLSSAHVLVLSLKDMRA